MEIKHADVVCATCSYQWASKSGSERGQFRYDSEDHCYEIECPSCGTAEIIPADLLECVIRENEEETRH